MRWTIVAAALLVAGCTKTVAEMNYSERQQLARDLVKRCHSQGVKDGTPEMNACLRVEAESETATRERRARIADAMAASPTVCSPIGTSVMCY